MGFFRFKLEKYGGRGGVAFEYVFGVFVVFEFFFEDVCVILGFDFWFF